MPDPEDREQQIARFAAEAAATADTTDTLNRIVEHARRLIGAPFAGITLRRGGGRLETVAASEPVVEQADALQYRFREGPCQQVATEPAEHVLLAGDLATDVRWPRWGPRAAGLGLHSVLSAELGTLTRRLGALNLYADKPRQFDAQDAAIGHVFAVHAAVALAGAIGQETLQTALQTRTRIGQAQGILMERFDLTAEQAFAVLSRYSQTTNIKLHDLAETLIRTRQLPPLENN